MEEHNAPTRYGDISKYSNNTIYIGKKYLEINKKKILTIKVMV